MQSLKALNLVEGVPGPKGGYRATGSAYEALSLDATGDVVEVPVVKNGVTVEGASATEIVFNKVMKSHECGGVVRIIGNVRDFNVGDEIEIGPTPVNKLYIRGHIVGRDDTMSRLLFNISTMISVPRIPIKGSAKRAVRISPSASLQEALVDDTSPGLVSMIDITRAIADGKTDLKVSEIMTRGFLTIDSEEPIYEAIKMLGRNGSSQLVVSESGSLWGIITAADLVKSLTPT